MRNRELFCGLVLAAGCMDTNPTPDAAPQARLIVVWDPLVCGVPHRVVLELEDTNGADMSRSVPCEIGGMTLDVGHWGVYLGRLYAWTPSANAYAIARVRLDLDMQIIYWTVETPR